MTPPPQVKTRLLVLSDTHGAVPAPALSPPDVTAALEASRATISAQWSTWVLPSPFREPLPHAGVDVVVHCGDLTQYGSGAELATALDVLRAHPAPLKIVIGGNHDYNLVGAGLPADPAAEERHDYDLSMGLFRDAAADGVVFLEREGVHEFGLANGARLRVYASAWTPRFGNGAFQYPRADGHAYDVPSGVDVVVSHGPPKYVLDQTKGGEHVGAEDLWRAVARAPPKVHCFGHIHESWGAKVVRWAARPGGGDGGGGGDDDDGGAYLQKVDYSSEVLVDAERSEVVVSEHTVKPFITDDDETLARKRRVWCGLVADGRAVVDLTDARWRTEQAQTLFVNAAIRDRIGEPFNPPWVVDVMLDAAARL
jgi:hypothetical protein